MITPISYPQDKIIVLVFGTFDKLHPGHEYFLEQAKSNGEYLVVVLARDDNVEKLKGRRPSQSEQERRQAILKNEYVDEAILGRTDYSKRYSVINSVRPDVICLGYDQAPDFKSPDNNIKVIRIDSYHPGKYKSSLL